MDVGCLIQLNEKTVENIERFAKTYGFKSGHLCSWQMSLYTKEMAESIKKVCKENDFTITAVWCGWSGPGDWGYPEMYNTIGLVPAKWRAQRTEDILNGAKFAEWLGVRNIITHVDYLPDNPNDTTYIDVLQAVKKICNKIEEYGQTFLFETGEMLPNTLLHFILGLGVENVGINFDPSNLLTSGRSSSVEALKRFVPYVRSMHIKDGTSPKGTDFKGKQTEVGKGEANFPELFKILAENNFRGHLAIENELSYITDETEREKMIVETKLYIEEIITKTYKN